MRIKFNLPFRSRSKNKISTLSDCYYYECSSLKRKKNYIQKGMDIFFLRISFFKLDFKMWYYLRSLEYICTDTNKIKCRSILKFIIKFPIELYSLRMEDTFFGRAKKYFDFLTN